jgi:hypothetical protein
LWLSRMTGRCDCPHQCFRSIIPKRLADVAKVWSNDERLVALDAPDANRLRLTDGVHLEPSRWASDSVHGEDDDCTGRTCEEIHVVDRF